MTDDAKTRFTARSSHRLIVTALAASAALVTATTAWAGTALAAHSPSSTPSPSVSAAPASSSPAPSASPTPEPYSCAPNGPAGSQTIFGTFGELRDCADGYGAEEPCQFLAWTAGVSERFNPEIAGMRETFQADQMSDCLQKCA